MASCCRRYRARRLKALGQDPQLLVIRPAPPATSLDHLKPFKLSTALMAVHKDCYAPIGIIQQGGPRRRETHQIGTVGEIIPESWATSSGISTQFNNPVCDVLHCWPDVDEISGYGTFETWRPA